MRTISFTSSDAFMEADPRAAELAEVEIPDDYLEATYAALRCGPDGKEIAFYLDGAWTLEDGRRFSDWAVRL